MTTTQIQPLTQSRILDTPSIPYSPEFDRHMLKVVTYVKAGSLNGLARYDAPGTYIAVTAEAGLIESEGRLSEKDNDAGLRLVGRLSQESHSEPVFIGTIKDLSAQFMQIRPVADGIYEVTKQI